jgi:predicted ABC-type transport system involved in lysophospholipase L1 biosynthesis ATPase subunit
MIELQNVSKSYRQGDQEIRVLTDVSLSIATGEKVAIVGASGSGKSTLLSIMSGMDTPDFGTVRIDGKDIGSMDERELADLRNKSIGVIFQSFELVPSFTALENVMLPLDIRGSGTRGDAKRALESVGLSHRLEHLPSMLSGGEEQRVAIARALAQSPAILFADEPTGNLDRKTGEEVLRLIRDTLGETERTLVIITHDMGIAKTMDRVLRIEDGKVTDVHL